MPGAHPTSNTSNSEQAAGQGSSTVWSGHNTSSAEQGRRCRGQHAAGSVPARPVESVCQSVKPSQCQGVVQFALADARAPHRRPCPQVAERCTSTAKPRLGAQVRAASKEQQLGQEPQQAAKLQGGPASCSRLPYLAGVLAAARLVRVVAGSRVAGVLAAALQRGTGAWWGCQDGASLLVVGQVMRAGNQRSSLHLHPRSAALTGWSGAWPPWVSRSPPRPPPSCWCEGSSARREKVIERRLVGGTARRRCRDE